MLAALMNLGFAAGGPTAVEEPKKVSMSLARNTRRARRRCRR